MKINKKKLAIFSLSITLVGCDINTLFEKDTSENNNSVATSLNNNISDSDSSILSSNNITSDSFQSSSSLSEISNESSYSSSTSSSVENMIGLEYEIVNEEYIEITGCDKTLKEVVIPSTIEVNGKTYSVTTIKNCAFLGCSSLTSVVILNSVITIEYSAFSYCSSLESVVIPNSVTSIGMGAFSRCSSLTIYCEKRSKPSGWSSYWNYMDRPVYWGVSAEDIIEENGIQYLIINENAVITRYIGNEMNVEIPSTIKANGKTYSVDEIGDYAFSYCSSLISIVIPNSVITIGYKAFNGCDSLKYNEYDNGLYLGNEDNPYLLLVKAKDTSITSCIINENTRFIYRGAFSGCSSITSITLPFVGGSRDSNHYLGYIFGANSYKENSTYVPSSLKEVIILEGCATIGKGAFYCCSSLTSVVIPNSVTTIEYDAFAGCHYLTSIVIPNSVTKIGDSAFSGSIFLTIYCEASSQPSGWSSSWNSSNKPVYWGVSAEDIIEENGIQYLIINENAIIIRYIGNEMNVEIPSTIEINSKTYNVTEIGNGAFAGCSSLTSIVIPSSATTIGDYAFFRCSSLTTIIIPNSVTSIGNGAFSGCDSLKYSEYDNVLYLGTEENPYLILVKAKDTNITSCIINENTRFIHSNAFEECSFLISIVIPNSVTSIGVYAFYECSSLTSIVIPNSVTTIGQLAFYGCDSLTIYCEASSQTSGWDSYWNYSDCPVVWGYKGS